MKPDAASVEDVQRRFILSQLQRGHYPQDILDVVVDHTMKVADAAGLGWSRDTEVSQVSRRILAQFKYATAKWAWYSRVVAGSVPRGLDARGGPGAQADAGAQCERVVYPARGARRQWRKWKR